MGRSPWGACVSESTGVPINPVEESGLSQSMELARRKRGSLATSLLGRQGVYPLLHVTEGHEGPHESDNLLIITWPFSEISFPNTHCILIFELYLFLIIFYCGKI